ncbi:MerR family transcriptional regulator [Streptomyces europaeiscabiei]|uniref:Cobalamin B12-binding domain-containing protein n=2 Tax=Streptomyces europaeiscabiei TaxID=146819 RepID=A0ABU4NGQ2_9ACTN|nr:cobalamin B12-binding domain-containing protein [Streptomyces europaeiscabiei]MDX2526496.1 cobalamin B12-binding domain-containing protein [Streptomyces europaeiscabiei]MDX2766781.1 cobalamin B12-binding domain-containing protein [Streptomyces europaeiscabiei]MDX3544087.1 cobalamin B12-binding domain-containing protein [Streptomyces europaeiscabiei]MDX3552321.1 cobalamin B12-binding domain-containing protein [Streptomyces europaeiscabiei]MDX3701113.1 cobalamin B12-binding domain-containing 
MGAYVEENAADPGLTSGALARRLGVSPTTLRSWDRRYGIGPAVRTDGRHRRWTPQDVAVVEAMCRLTSAGLAPAEAARAAREGVATPRTREAQEGAGGARVPDGDRPWRSPAPGPPSLADLRQECRGLARAAVRLDAPAVEDLLAGAVERHGLTVAWQEVMVPTLHVVGRKWASSGDRYIEVEHLLSWHVSTTLRRHPGAPASRHDTTAPGPVVLACVPGEQHSLPLEALTAALGELGLPARMFGADVPAEALTGAVDRLGPAAVVLWAQARSTASLSLARHVAAMRWGVKGARRQSLVVLGGPGWHGHPASGMVRPSSLDEAVEALSGLYGRAVRPVEDVRPRRNRSRPSASSTIGSG